MSVAEASDAARGYGWTLDALIANARAVGERLVELDQTGDAVPEEEAKTATVLKESREEVTIEDATMVVDAPVLEGDARERLRRRGPKNHKEGNALRRAAMAEYYGSAFTTADRPRQVQIARYDDDGRGRARSRTFAHVLAVGAKGPALAAIKEMDLRELRGSTSAIRLRHRTLDSLGIVTSLSKFGVHLPGLIAMASEKQSLPAIDPSVATEAATWCAKSDNRKSLALLGITVRSDATEKPMQLLGTILRRIGISLSSKRVSDNTTKARGYVTRVDAKTLLEANTLSAAYSSRLSAGPVDVRSFGEAEVDLHDLPSAVNGRISDEDAAALLAMIA